MKANKVLHHTPIPLRSTGEGERKRWSKLSAQTRV